MFKRKKPRMYLHSCSICGIVFQQTYPHPHTPSYCITCKGVSKSILTIWDDERALRYFGSSISDRILDLHNAKRIANHST